jgi:hypothetical protein
MTAAAEVAAAAEVEKSLREWGRQLALLAAPADGSVNFSIRVTRVALEDNAATFSGVAVAIAQAVCRTMRQQERMTLAAHYADSGTVDRKCAYLRLGRSEYYEELRHAKAGLISAAKIRESQRKA